MRGVFRVKELTWKEQLSDVISSSDLNHFVSLTFQAVSLIIMYAISRKLKIKYTIQLGKSFFRYDSMLGMQIHISFLFSFFFYFCPSFFVPFFLYYFHSYFVFVLFLSLFSTCWSLVPSDIGPLWGRQLRHWPRRILDWQKPRAYDVWSLLDDCSRRYRNVAKKCLKRRVNNIIKYF